MITIDRPEKRNAMTYAMLAEFIETVGRADDDPRHGGDRGDRRSGCVLRRDRPRRPGDRPRRVARTARRGRGTRQVVAPRPGAQADGLRDRRAGGRDGRRVHVAVRPPPRESPNARFAWNFVHRGLVPDTGAGTWLLPRIVGLQPALQLLYTGEMIGADAALAARLRARRRRERRAASRRRWSSRTRSPPAPRTASA